jgi:hypothetical protein
MPTATIRATTLAMGAVCAFAGTAQAWPGHTPPANTLTIVLDGTLGPVIKGSDPAHLDGESATVTVTISESAKPYKTTANSASYFVPKGDITVDVNGTNYSTTSKSKMMIKLGSKADLLTLKASLSIDGYKITVADVSSLESGSWSNSVLQHPTVFSPSPQDLTSPSSNFTYTVFGETTELGVTGTASNSDAADTALADLR